MASLPRNLRARACAVVLLLSALLLWTWVALRYASLSAIPLHPAAVLLHVSLLTLGHYLIGSSLAWVLARRERLGPDAWAWNILLGSGALPALLWSSDQLGVRAAGWGLTALLALGGLVLELGRARASVRSRDAIPALALFLCLAGAAAVGLDHIVYVRPLGQGVVLTPPEDNLVHAAFALEWARQEPYRHLMLAFTPEPIGIQYHYLTDVQLGAWWTLAGGDHLDFVHLDRFLLQGVAFLIGLYLLARALLESKAWALVTVGLFAALPYWFLDLDLVPQRESLQRLWTSFTFQNGAAFGAGFLACLWAWLHRGQTGMARIALVLAGMLLLAKAYFAVLAWTAACSLVLFLRPRAWAWWIGALALIGVGLNALQPHGPDIIAMHPEWAPGRFWESLLASQGDRGPAAFVEWIAAGLAVLGAGALGAGLALRRAWPSGKEGRGLVVLIAASWCAFLAYVSFFWFLDAHQTAFQFLPWLSLVSVFAGLAGCRAALDHWLDGRRGLRLGLICSGIALWGLVLAGAWRATDGFAKVQWPTYSLTADAWETLRYLRTRTPATARVLAPFEPSEAGALPSPYAVAGVAGRRAVNEHSGLAVWLPGLAERIALRKAEVGELYRDPRLDRLRTLAARWELDYLVLPSRRALQVADDLGRTVFTTPQWSVVEVRKP